MTNDSIVLHRAKGLNPRLGVCPRCGRDNGVVMLLGNRDWKAQCECGRWLYGFTKDEPCPECGSRSRGAPLTLSDGERVPGVLCMVCESEVAEQKALVEAGGVYFRCSGCGATGVVRPGSPLAEKARKQMGVPAPEACGVELETCPWCEEVR